MQQLEINESLIVNNNNSKKESNKKKNILKIITIIFFLYLIIFFIFIHTSDLKLLNKEKENNDKLNKIIDRLVKERNEAKNIVDELTKWKEENERIKEEELKSRHIEYEIDSYILNNRDIQFISKQLTKDEHLINRKVIFNLIYRASRDGANANSYHKKCNGKKNLLTIVQTNKGNKFGGFTETEVQNNNVGYKDPNSFIFSLDKMKIYENMNKGGNVIRHYMEYGPYFVGGFVIFDIHFYENQKQNNYVYDKESSSNFFGKEEQEFEINNGENLFALRELEIYEILLE